MNPEQKTSLWRDAFRRFVRNRPAVAGCIFLTLAALLAIAAPAVAPYSYADQDLTLGAAGPDARHWLGTDNLGRDLFARTLFGGRISLLVGICATAVALLIGVTFGALSGYIGGRLDTFMMRFVDSMYAFPFTIFVIILMVFFQRSIVLLFCAIGCVEWLTLARIVRNQVRSLRKKEFVEAAICLGLPLHRILLRHIIPNILGPVIVYSTLTIPSVMLLEAFLSFLGLGVQPPMSSWGLLIKEGAESMESYPWLLVFPGLFLSLTLFSLNFIGDGLRDALDPWSAKD
jgi:oligopeptide transport system permease protein